MRDFPASPHPTQPATFPLPARTRGHNGLKWTLAVFAILVALLLGLLTLLIVGYETGFLSLLAGIVIAVLPAPVYVTLVLWLDRYEPEPKWMLATAFFWGALVAVFFAIIINSLGATLVETLFNKQAADFYGLIISAPVVEESAKAFALFTLYFWKRDEFDDVLDGIIYAAMVGLGFAMTENVKYYGEAVMGGSMVGAFIVRGMFSPFAHPLFTSMTGIGLGIASQTNRRAAKFVAPLAGFILAIILHGSWNAAAFFSTQFDNGRIALAMYFLVMVPIFAGVLVAVVFALRREGRILREHLRCDVERGLFPPDEYARLCSIRGRMKASLSAMSRGGIEAWRARRQLNILASELAFHRQRVAQSAAARNASEDIEREVMYMRTIDELRARLAASGN